MPELPAPISHTSSAILEASARGACGGDSLGVPMSDCANPCDRALWYRLRWAPPAEAPDGKRQRRFDSGAWYERRLLDDLRAIGCHVEDTDPATGRQWRVALARGWLRGKMDARATGIPEAPATEHVVEAKSHNERSFKELLKHAPPKGEGLRKSNPGHYAQCQSYMHATGLTRCLYIASNKNDDDVYTERVEYDPAYCLALEARIERIAATDRAPPRLHDDPASKAAFACAWCPSKALCHERAMPARRNCRTCLRASLEDGAVVRCTLTGAERSYDEQQAGCGEHRYLPDLVPGHQVDVRGETIVYCIGEAEWCDTGRAA